MTFRRLFVISADWIESRSNQILFRLSFTTCFYFLNNREKIQKIEDIKKNIRDAILVTRALLFFPLASAVFNYTCVYFYLLLFIMLCWWQSCNERTHSAYQTAWRHVAKKKQTKTSERRSFRSPFNMAAYGQQGEREQRSFRSPFNTAAYGPKGERERRSFRSPFNTAAYGQEGERERWSDVHFAPLMGTRPMLFGKRSERARYNCSCNLYWILNHIRVLWFVYS